MEQLPGYIYIVFILTSLLTLWLLYKATNNLKWVFIIIIWLALQAGVSLTGFYTVTKGMPPRFVLLLLPPVALIIIVLFTKKGKGLVDSFNVSTLTLLHIVRVPVELTLYWLFMHKAVPGLMTFEGRNFDILCGLTAPAVYYWGYIKNSIGRITLIGWNIACLLLLVNIVVTAVLSAPFSFQKLGFEQPNIALFYFPFVWLPCFIVPMALFAHLVSLRRLLLNKLS